MCVPDADGLVVKWEPPVSLACVVLTCLTGALWAKRDERSLVEPDIFQFDKVIREKSFENYWLRYART